MEEWKLGNETDDANMVIDQKLRQYFDGRIVRKDLTKSIKEGANVPVYVLEFLLGQYCSSDDDEVIEQRRQNVKRTYPTISCVRTSLKRCSLCCGNGAASP